MKIHCRQYFNCSNSILEIRNPKEKFPTLSLLTQLTDVEKCISKSVSNSDLAGTVFKPEVG